MIYAYHDSFLARHCTAAREARAIADVALLGTFPAPWTEKLVVASTYIIVCTEHQAAVDDLFTAKLKTYRGEFDKLLPLAKFAAEAAADDGPTGLGVFSIPLERA